MQILHGGHWWFVHHQSLMVYYVYNPCVRWVCVHPWWTWRLCVPPLYLGEFQLGDPLCDGYGLASFQQLGGYSLQPCDLQSMCSFMKAISCVLGGLLSGFCFVLVKSFWQFQAVCIQLDAYLCGLYSVLIMVQSMKMTMDLHRLGENSWWFTSSTWPEWHAL